MAISKKIRFEVFKRDGFKCGYCGKSPPTVILEIDHIDPKSKGGKDDINNLLTSCFDCNRGKTNTPLNRITPQLSENLEILKEKEDQLKEYRNFVRRVEQRVGKDIDDINQIYIDAFPGWQLSDTFKNVSIRRFLTLLPKHVIEESLHYSISKIQDKDNAVKYFCGVCWRKIKGTDKFGGS